MTQTCSKTRIAQVPSNSKTDTATVTLPPRIGKIGALLFFLALFTFADPNETGYEEFRKCHGDCVNGVLHAVSMPLAVSGVFLVVRSASDDADFTRNLQIAVASAYLGLYLRFESSSASPAIFYVVYVSVFELLHGRLYVRRETWSRMDFFLLGAALVALNVGFLEVVGHGYFEEHHSHVSEFFNSVFHTPLYGINSVLLSSGIVPPRQDHTCW